MLSTNNRYLQKLKLFFIKDEIDRHESFEIFVQVDTPSRIRIRRKEALYIKGKDSKRNHPINNKIKLLPTSTELSWKGSFCPSMSKTRVSTGTSVEGGAVFKSPEH